MKLLSASMMLALFATNCFAESDGRVEQDGQIESSQRAKSTEVSPVKSAALPEEVMTSVKEWNVEMRFFTAIGFHKHAKQKRDAIEAVYREHGLRMPDEYRE